jgi:cytochrome c553
MITKHRPGLALLALAAALPATAMAGGDPAAGKMKAFTCMGCHGIPGYNSVYPTYKVPKLGGQHEQYLVSALQAYKGGQRSHHPTMQAQAQSLSDQDIQDIAAFFAQSGGNGNH